MIMGRDCHGGTHIAASESWSVPARANVPRPTAPSAKPSGSARNGPIASIRGPKRVEKTVVNAPRSPKCMPAAASPMPKSEVRWRVRTLLSV